jgi:hypothetical protein
MAAKSTSIAKRGPSLAAKFSRATTSLRKLKTDIAASKVPNALINGGLVVAGAAGSGALKAALGRDEIAGVDAGVVGGLVAATAGAALGYPMLISLGAGMLSPYVADFTRDTIEDLMSRGNDATPDLRAVGAGN